jgi:hypothetical protein
LICHLKLYEGQIRGDRTAAYTSHYFYIVRNNNNACRFVFYTGVCKCQDFRSPYGALIDCDNHPHYNCSDEQRLLYFLMKYEI